MHTRVRHTCTKNKRTHQLLYGGQGSHSDAVMNECIFTCLAHIRQIIMLKAKKVSCAQSYQKGIVVHQITIQHSAFQIRFISDSQVRKTATVELTVVEIGKFGNWRQGPNRGRVLAENSMHSNGGISPTMQPPATLCTPSLRQSRELVVY